MNDVKSFKFSVETDADDYTTLNIYAEDELVMIMEIGRIEMLALLSRLGDSVAKAEKREMTVDFDLEKVVETTTLN